MNIITFKYTKANGSVSERVLSPVVKPSTNYEGTDITELGAEDQVMYVQALGKLRDEYLAKVNQLNFDFDVENHYRCFNADKMSEVIMEMV
jgi:hypothetical protein